MKLTHQQVDLLRRVGYLRLPERVPSDLLSKLKEALTKDFTNPTGKVYYSEDKRPLKIYDLYGRGEPYVSLITSSVILDSIESLVGPNIEFSRYRHNHATINAPGDNVSRMHRDILQWSRTIISVLVYLEEATIYNGCTRIIPGSHFFPFIGTPEEGAGVRLADYPEYQDFREQDVPVPMPAGGILVFDGSIFHAVGENKSDKTRMSIALSYHSIDELDKRESVPESVLVRGKKIYRGWQ